MIYRVFFINGSTIDCCAYSYAMKYVIDAKFNKNNVHTATENRDKAFYYQLYLTEQDSIEFIGDVYSKTDIKQIKRILNLNDLLNN